MRRRRGSRKPITYHKDLHQPSEEPMCYCSGPLHASKSPEELSIEEYSWRIFLPSFLPSYPENYYYYFSDFNVWKINGSKPAAAYKSYSIVPNGRARVKGIIDLGSQNLAIGLTCSPLLHPHEYNRTHDLRHSMLSTVSSCAPWNRCCRLIPPVPVSPHHSIGTHLVFQNNTYLYYFYTYCASRCAFCCPSCADASVCSCSPEPCGGFGGRPSFEMLLRWSSAREG